MPPTDTDDLILRSIRGAANVHELEELDDYRRVEIDALSRLGAVVRATTPEDSPRLAPPPGLWERIADETGEAEHPTNIVYLAAERSRRTPFIAGLAAAVVALIAGVAVLAARDDARQGELLAQVELDELVGIGSGSARLVRLDGAELRLELDVEGLDPGDGFLEVWLLDPGVTQLVSLGPLRADGTYDLPPGLDPTVLPVVDISVEPFDGDPTHSGNSLLRGQLSV